MTLFNTPILSHALWLISAIILKIIGWKGILKRPPDGHKKFLLVVAPHTSNWDFVLFIFIVSYLRLDLRVMIKKEAFWGPLAWFLRYCGALPIDRSKPTALVKSIVDEFNQRDSMVLVITPEGTRSATRNWKTGFYRISQVANIPIGVTYLDAQKREVVVDHFFFPTGDLEGDLKKMKAIYDTKPGINPQNYLS